MVLSFRVTLVPKHDNVNLTMIMVLNFYFVKLLAHIEICFPCCLDVSMT